MHFYLLILHYLLMLFVFIKKEGQNPISNIHETKLC